MRARSRLQTQAQVVALYWGAHLEIVYAGLPGKDCYVGVAYVRSSTTPNTMLKRNGVILLVTVLLLFSSADKSCMAGNHRQTLPVVGEV